MDLVHHMHAVSKETRREHQISGAGVADGCEVTFGSWESNPARSLVRAARALKYRVIFPAPHEH